LFQENFELFGELGAAVSVWQNGKPLIDLYGGFCDAGREKPWTADTVVLVWSATKGIGSACVLHALQQQKIELNRPSLSSGPNLGRQTKTRSRSGNCFRIRRGFVLWISALTWSITTE
jgi:Beta-lactamase class C and other penicillin binding proteins